MIGLSVDFILGDRELPLREAVLWDDVSAYGVFSGKEYMGTFTLDVLMDTDVVQALVVTAKL